jgi:hypothetical protein
MKYTFQDAFAEILPHQVPEYFWQTTASGELEFAVPEWDVRTTPYLVALASGEAPLSPNLNLRRISGKLSNPGGSFQMDKYLKERGDERVKDWASWVANEKFKSDAQRAGAQNSVGEKDPRGAPDSISYLKMQSVLRLVVSRSCTKMESTPS